MRLDEALKEATVRLQMLPEGEGRRDARVLLTSLLDDREILFREPEKELSPELEGTFFEWVARRASREPVSHIIGLREFYGYDFHVSGDVLDPRPDSETLIEAVLTRQGKATEDLRILDLGTGSGCLMITLLLQYPVANGVAVDLSSKALEMAKKNAEKHEVSERLSFLEGRWFEPVNGQFHVIVSNPPYIESDVISSLQPEVKDFEPHLALDGGSSGLDCYRDILKDATRFVYPGGLIVFEIGQGQEQELSQLLKNAGFDQIEFHKDLASVVRCVSGRLKR